MPNMQVGLHCYPSQPGAADLAARLQDALQASGVKVWTDAESTQEQLIQRVPNMDMLITLGGDGTILHAARLAAPHGIPVLGVNLGRLGFLAEMEPHEVLEQLPRLCNRDYWLEDRLMLHAEHWRGDRLLGGYEALNDVFVGRGAAARVMRLSVSVDGAQITTYYADGIIVATPTGSTAYSLSAGGPVAAPGIENIVVTPVAPHLTPARSLVLPAACHIEVGVSTNHDGILTVDGNSDFGLEHGDLIHIVKSEDTARFVRLGGSGYFFETLIQRLNRRLDHL